MEKVEIQNIWVLGLLLSGLRFSLSLQTRGSPSYTELELDPMARRHVDTILNSLTLREIEITSAFTRKSQCGGSLSSAPLYSCLSPFSAATVSSMNL